MIRFLLVYAFAILSLNTEKALAAPTILFAGVDQPVVDWDSLRNLTFSLIATDSGGIDHLAGAVLLDPLKNVPYGTFKTGTKKGAYEIVLSASQILAVRQFDPFGSRVRDFQILIFNQAGESISSTIPVTINRDNHLLTYRPVSWLNRWTLENPEGYHTRVERVINGAVVPGVMWQNDIWDLTMFFKNAPSSTNHSDECRLAGEWKVGMGQSVIIPEPDCQTAFDHLIEACAAAQSYVVTLDNYLPKDRAYGCNNGHVKYVSFRSDDGLTIDQRQSVR